MQKRVLTVAALTLVLFGFIWNSAVTATDEMCVPMEEITLESPADDPIRSSVSFPHTAHFNHACQQCHHKWTITEPIVGCATSGCHDLNAVPVDDNGKPVKNEKQSIRYYKTAYHQKCIGCHKAIKIKNKAAETSAKVLDQVLPATGPTSCNACHPK
jgi:hypothetical protein